MYFSSWKAQIKEIRNSIFKNGLFKKKKKIGTTFWIWMLVILPVSLRKFSSFGNASFESCFSVLFAHWKYCFKMKIKAYFTSLRVSSWKNKYYNTEFIVVVKLCSSSLFNSDVIYRKLLHVMLLPVTQMSLECTLF